MLIERGTQACAARTAQCVFVRFLFFFFFFFCVRFTTGVQSVSKFLDLRGVLKALMRQPSVFQAVKGRVASITESS